MIMDILLITGRTIIAIALMQALSNKIARKTAIIWNVIVWLYIRD